MKSRVSFLRKQTALLLTALLLLSCCSILAFAQSVGTVKAKQTARTNRTATVTWTKSGTVTGCEVLRYNKQTKKYDSLGKTTKTAYKLSALAPGEEYVVMLRPYATVGGKQTAGKAVKLRVYTAISAVSKLSHTETTETSHKLTWKKVTGAEKYLVYYYNAAAKRFNLLGETANDYAVIRQLKPGTLYKYRVRAVSVASDGKRILADKSKTYTAYTVPGSIKNFRVTDLTTTSYRLQWDAAAGATGYIVYRFDPNTGDYAEVTKTAAPSYTVRGLAAGTTDYYQICAYAMLQKVSRAGAMLKAQGVTTKPETVAPKYVSGDPARGKFKIKWTPNENVDGYRVFVTETEGKNYTQVLEVPLAATKTAVVKLDKKCDKLFVYLQTYLVTDAGRVYSDYSPALIVTTPPPATTTGTAAQTTTASAKK